MPNHCAPPLSPSFADSVMERRFDNHAAPPRFIEPRQLTLNHDDPSDEPPRPLYDDPAAAFPLDPALRSEGPPPHGYASLGGYSHPFSPGFVEHERRMGFPGGDSPFLWGGDYAPGMTDPHDVPRMPYEDWIDPAFHGRPELDFERPPFPPMGFPGSFPSIDDAFGQHLPGMPFPPPHGFPPFMYGPGPGEGGPPFGDPFPPQLPQAYSGHPLPPNNLPLLPSLNSLNLAEASGHIESQPPSAVQPHAHEKAASTSTRKPRIDRRNSKPLTVEELAHDNSRFAKVVKAFLSIEEPESRTVPEIAKRVSEMYAGQYADFEGVKRMVNDVLQKHKAFWHPGRGSPYQLNLMEGRARREFPSNNKHMRGFDENLFYPGRPERRKARKNFSRKGSEMTPDREFTEPPEPKVLQPGIVDAPESSSIADASLLERVLSDTIAMVMAPPAPTNNDIPPAPEAFATST